MIRITNDLFESIRKITSPEVKTLSEETQVETTEEQIDEALKGGQVKLDKNKIGRAHV